MSKHYDSLCSGREKFEESQDCAVVAVSKVTGINYLTVNYVFQWHGRKPKQATPNTMIHAVLDQLGYRLQRIDVLSRTVARIETELRLRAEGGRYLIWTSRHVLAFDGDQICDWTQGRRHRVKCVHRVSKVSEE